MRETTVTCSKEGPGARGKASTARGEVHGKATTTRREATKGEVSTPRRREAPQVSGKVAITTTTGGAHSVAKSISRGGRGATNVNSLQGQEQGRCLASLRVNGVYHDTSRPFGSLWASSSLPRALPWFCPRGLARDWLVAAPPTLGFFFPGGRSGGCSLAVSASPVAPVGHTCCLLLPGGRFPFSGVP